MYTAKKEPRNDEDAIPSFYPVGMLPFLFQFVSRPLADGKPLEYERMAVCLTDKYPLTAFGAPVPVVQVEDFE